MPRKTPPSMDLFVDDLIGGTYYLHVTAFGMYFRCICYQWNNDFLPEDESELQDIMGCDAQLFAEHWPKVRKKFEREEGKGLYNPRAKAEKDKKLDISRKRADAARQKGKQQLHSKSTANAQQTGSGKSEGGSGDLKEKEEIDPRLVLTMNWWNELQAAGHVHARVHTTTPSKGVIAGWKRCLRSPHLMTMVQNRNELAKKIIASDFLSKPWFTLPKLLGSKNEDGEMIIEKILDGSYSSGSRTKQGAGQKFVEGTSDKADSL